jgi:hypothetical protein
MGRSFVRGWAQVAVQQLQLPGRSGMETSCHLMNLPGEAYEIITSYLRFKEVRAGKGGLTPPRAAPALCGPHECSPVVFPE